jgi:hypothetical protein
MVRARGVHAYSPTVQQHHTSHRMGGELRLSFVSTHTGGWQRQHQHPVSQSASESMNECPSRSHVAQYICQRCTGAAPTRLPQQAPQGGRQDASRCRRTKLHAELPSHVLPHNRKSGDCAAAALLCCVQRIQVPSTLYRLQARHHLIHAWPGIRVLRPAVLQGHGGSRRGPGRSA